MTPITTCRRLSIKLRPPTVALIDRVVKETGQTKCRVVHAMAQAYLQAPAKARHNALTASIRELPPIFGRRRATD